MSDSRDPSALSVHGLMKCINRMTQSRGLGSASAFSSYRVSVEVRSDPSPSTSMRALLLEARDASSTLAALSSMNWSHTVANSAQSKQHGSRKDVCCHSRAVIPCFPNRYPFKYRVEWKYPYISDLNDLAADIRSFDNFAISKRRCRRNR